MTSVLIIVEMTGGYSLILPLMIANMTAYILARRFRPMPVYEALLEQDGIHLAEAAPPTLDEFPLRHASRSERVHTFTVASGAAEITRAATEDSHQSVYPVLDREGKLIGIITWEDIRLLRAEPELFTLVNAADLMRPAVFVDVHANLSIALEAMIGQGLTEIPVTEDGCLVGLIGEADIARVFLKGHRRHVHSLHD